MKLLKTTILAAMLPCMLAACTEDSPVTNPAPSPSTPVEIDRTAFARGADVSWVTELEKLGYTFMNAAGEQKECMRLLRDDCGVNSIRLRVWVNPAEGWNNIDDVVIKARRANSLGQRVMIDFHFSDTWADPGAQITPAAWADMDLPQLKEAMADHISQMLGALKKENIFPEWVQIGNETRSGMMYPLGHIDNSFTELVNTGYDAVKAIFPESKVIVHVDSGDRADLFDRVFGLLREQGGKYDMIGMSLYPEADNWQTMVENCVDNARRVAAEYETRVMICEIGIDYREEAVADAMMRLMMRSAMESGVIDGIFWWEPEAPADRGYTKGCFVDGIPTHALDVFKEQQQ